MGKQNRYYLITSEFKAQNRVYIADLESPGQVKLVDFLGKREANRMREGDFGLLKVQDDVAVIKYSSCSEPPRVYAVFFNSINDAGSLGEISFESMLLDEVVLEADLLN